MSADQPQTITRLLADVRDKKPGAAERLAELILPELEKIASAILRGENPDNSLYAGELVDSIYPKLDPEARNYQDRVHFKAYASKLMRWKLIDKARKRIKQGQRVELDEAAGIASPNASEASLLRAIELSRLNDALEKLRLNDERAAEVVEKKFFGGLTNEEIAELLGFDVSTIKRDWRFARSFLLKELNATQETLLGEPTRKK